MSARWLRERLGVLPGDGLRVGFDSRGRYSASRYPAEHGMVLHDEPPVVPAPKPRPPTARPTEPTTRTERAAETPRPFRTFNPLSQCAGKRGYTSKAEAKAAATRTEQKPGAGRLHAYRCSHCGMFHTGHPPRVPQAQRDDVGRGEVVVVPPVVHFDEESVR